MSNNHSESTSIEARNTTTKADVANEVYELGGLTKRAAVDIVDLVFEIVKKELEAGEVVKISRFGNLDVRDKPPRMGRNPLTGTESPISARRSVRFKASETLKDRLNATPVTPEELGQTPE